MENENRKGKKMIGEPATAHQVGVGGKELKQKLLQTECAVKNI
jgi:hypothetical protein